MSKILEKLADQHEQRIINVLYKLEEDVVKEVTRATKGQLVSQRLAIQLQPQIRKLVADNYLNEADIIINEEYNKIAKEVLDTFGEMPIPKKFKSLTEVDLQTINALKTQSFSGFEDIAERFSKVINDEIYQSTIAGRPFEDMVSNIKSHINGVYKTSNTAEINELVDFINENKFDSTKKAQVEDAVRKLHTQYASDRAGNNLRRYASQIAHDSVMQFHGQFTVAKAKEAGLNHFTYTGTLVRDSRPFCVEMLNRTLTEEQIRDMWNNRAWQGKSTGDPFIVRGGYRCRHTWIPTDPSWGEETVDEVPEEPVVEETPIPSVVDETDIFTPINRENVTEETIQILSINEATKRLNKVFGDASKDDRYINKKTAHFNGVNPEKQFGKISGKKLNNQELSMIASLIPEIEELTKKFKIPMIRGVSIHKDKQLGNGNMGDGVLGIWSGYLEKTSKTLGKKRLTEAERTKLSQEFNKEVNKVRQEYLDLNKQIADIQRKFGATDSSEWAKLATGQTVNGFQIGKGKLTRQVYFEENEKIVKIANKQDVLGKKFTEIQKRLSYELHTPFVKWKRGDALDKRAWSARGYEDNNFDQFRALIYHEIGHHVHQQYKSKSFFAPAFGKEPTFDSIRRPLESKLKKVSSGIANMQELRKSSPTQYGASNEYEWFVENFSLYYRGKEELVSPEFIKILGEIQDDVIT